MKKGEIKGFNFIVFETRMTLKRNTIEVIYYFMIPRKTIRNVNIELRFASLHYAGRVNSANENVYMQFQDAHRRDDVLYTSIESLSSNNRNIRRRCQECSLSPRYRFNELSK